MNKKKKGKKRKITEKILIIIFILVALLIILLIIHYSRTYLLNIGKEPKLFVIEDECLLLLNNIIHQIKNQGECKIVCRNECGVRKMNFHDSEFIEKENSCHTCNCYCE